VVCLVAGLSHKLDFFCIEISCNSITPCLMSVIVDDVWHVSAI